MLYTNLFDAEARVAGIYPIAMIGDPENPPEWVEQFAEEAHSPSAQAIFSVHPEIEALRGITQFKRSSDHAIALAEAWVMAGREGFIVRTEICLREYLGNGSSAYYSGWGIVQLSWIYVESVDRIEPTVLALATDMHNAAKTKAGAA